jgi:putative PIN family toxin of toxin-antitoxin system
MRAVLDTSVLVSALRSPAGASNLLVQAVFEGQMRPLISVALALEYEAVLTRPEHLAVSGFDPSEAMKIVNAFCSRGEPVHIAHRLRPQLVDPDDEFILETAYHGDAECIVTFNRRDFALAARKFGIDILSPAEAVRKLRNR